MEADTKRAHKSDQGNSLYIRMSIKDVMEQILAYICQPQIILHNRTYACTHVDTWNANLTLATLNEFGWNFLLVNHETRKAVYDCVLNTSWRYHVDLMKDIMFDLFMEWLWTDSIRLRVFKRNFKVQYGPPSKETKLNAFTFTGENIDISTDEDPGHTILQIRLYENNADDLDIISSSRNFETSCRFGDIAKYMSDQMFTEKINKHLADRVLANHLAIETRRIKV